MYTISLKKVKAKLTSFRESYRTLARFSYKKRGEIYHTKLGVFQKLMHTLFDIIADRNQCEKLGKTWAIKMVDEDFEFHKNTSQFPQIGYCSSFVARKWKISNKKKGLTSQI